LLPDWSEMSFTPSFYRPAPRRSSAAPPALGGLLGGGRPAFPAGWPVEG
jgi:hypothetical protein